MPSILFASALALAIGGALAACGSRAGASGSATPPAGSASPGATVGAATTPLVDDGGAVGATLLFDGVYYAPSFDPRGQQIGWDFVRFYPDGAVVTLSTPGTLDEVLPFLRNEDDHPGKGHYKLEGPRIVFAATSSYGAVEYEGLVQKERMDLRWHSKINDVHGGGMYGFEHVPAGPAAAAGGGAGGGTGPDESGAAGAPPDEALKPAGSGWFCTHDAAKRASGCTRARADCEKLRQFLHSKHRVKTSDCGRHDAAFCYTTTAGPVCYETQPHCEGAIAELRAMKAPASDCARW